MSFYQQHRGGKFVKEIAALATYNGTSWHCSPCTWGARAEVLRSRAGVKVKTKLIAKLWKYKTSAPTIVMGNGFVLVFVLSCTYNLYCMSAHPGRGIPPLWLFLRFPPSFFVPSVWTFCFLGQSFTVQIVKPIDTMWFYSILFIWVQFTLPVLHLEAWSYCVSLR